MVLLWKGRDIWGMINLADLDLRAAYLRHFEAIPAR
jgi:hypothetical protein